MNGNLKGTLLAIVSAIFLTFGFVSIKYLLNFTNPTNLNVLWMGTGLLVSLYIASIRKTRWIPVIRQHWGIGIVLGGLIGIGSILMFYAINSIGPSLSSFLVRFAMVFTVVLGIVFLKERLTKFEILGMIIAVMGVVMISFVTGAVQLGSLFVIVSSLLFAINGILTKMYIKRISPLGLTILRDVFTVAFVFLFALASGSLQAVRFDVVVLTTLASGLSVVGFLFFLKALQLMDLTKVMIIRSLDPFLVVIYSLIFFHSFPTVMQIIGGSLIVFGVMVAITRHHIKRTADAIKSYALLKFVER